MSTILKRLLNKIKKDNMQAVSLDDNTHINIIKKTGELIPLPQAHLAPTSAREDYLSNIRTVKESYPLVTTNINNVKHIVASAHISFNPLVNQLTYNLYEPQLDNNLRDLVEKTLTELHNRLEIGLNHLGAKKEVYNYVDQKIDEIWTELKVDISETDTIKAKYFIFRDTVGLGKIEALMRDPNLEDISCDGIGLPVFIFHRNPLYGELPTNISFDSKDELDAFVMKLAQKTGRTVSVASPLLDAALSDGSRIQITYGTDIARKGSNFSIRKFFKIPMTIADLVGYGTADPMMLAYLWLAIEEQQSILVAGTTAVGKTTFLNAIAGFIYPTLKIVSIEDTPELQLMHTNWIPQVARGGFGPKQYGEISMFDLLKASMRQRPDYIIVGEVRGTEANVMFQAMATGHSSLSTLHADNINAVIDRLTTRPINLPMSLLENLDIIVFMEKVKKRGRFSRKVGQILEIENYDRESKKLNTNEAFNWDSASDNFIAHNSYVLTKIAKRQGWTMKQVHDELLRRANVIIWLQKKKITGFRNVSNAIRMYYSNPAELAKQMEG